MTGIEPAWPAWKAGALPLSYTRETSQPRRRRPPVRRSRFSGCPVPVQGTDRPEIRSRVRRPRRARQSPRGLLAQNAVGREEFARQHLADHLRSAASTSVTAARPATSSASVVRVERHSTNAPSKRLTNAIASSRAPGRVEAGGLEPRRRGDEPALEHLGRRDPQRLVRARDLEARPSRWGRHRRSRSRRAPRPPPRSSRALQSRRRARCRTRP